MLSLSSSDTILPQHKYSKVPFTLVWAAHARARSVFPVPGGPYIRTPLGGCIPKFSNFSLWFMGRTMASTSYSKRKLLSQNQTSQIQAARFRKFKACCPHSHSYHLLDLFIKPPDVTVLLCGSLIHFHGFHPWIIFSWQSLQDQVRVLVHTLQTQILCF